VAGPGRRGGRSYRWIVTRPAPNRWCQMRLDGDAGGERICRTGDPGGEGRRPLVKSAMSSLCGAGEGDSGAGRDCRLGGARCRDVHLARRAGVVPAMARRGGGRTRSTRSWTFVAWTASRAASGRCGREACARRPQTFEFFAGGGEHVAQYSRVSAARAVSSSAVREG
jgi:hypothetical protein